MPDYEGYCERCGKAGAGVGLCGRCQQTADLLSTIADLREEVKQLKAAPPADDRVAEKHDTPTYCPYCGTQWISRYSVEDDQCSYCGTSVGMLFPPPADDRIAELELHNQLLRDRLDAIRAFVVGDTEPLATEKGQDDES